MYKKNTALLCASALFHCLTSWAAIDQAPPSFAYRNGEAVFVDFERAHYSIEYDVTKRSASVVSQIDFVIPKEGYPLFDLVPTPTAVKLDGAAVDQVTVRDPDSQTTLRILHLKTAPGKHHVEIHHSFSDQVNWKGSGVASAFWMSDLDDRQYLEQYLPANLEFDAYPATLSVKVLGADNTKHVVMANGQVQELGTSAFEITFPEFYTASSMFFHIFPAETFKTESSNYKSVDGREIPITVYGGSLVSLSKYIAEAKKVLNELETDYAPFPHPKVIIYGGGISGGMEYSGATVTALWALGHELFHSYHARALMPANGNAGWMDEAIASWRDDGYQTKSSLKGSTKMAGHSKWNRVTDRAAYTAGSQLMSWLDFQLTDAKSGLKKFLTTYFNNFKFHTVTTEDFRQELIRAMGEKFTSTFDSFVYGTKSTAPHLVSAPPQDSPYHPKLSKEELLQLMAP